MIESENKDEVSYDLVKMCPGEASSKPFTIQMCRNYLDQGTIFCYNPPQEWIITKVYPLNLWRKLLLKLGFKVPMFKAKPYYK